MKQRLSISVIITFLILFIAQSSQGQKKNQGAGVSKASQTSFKWKTITLPTTVGQLITLYGNYTKFIPCTDTTEEDPCNYETYYWKINNGLNIYALAIEYTFGDKANKLQKIGAYELEAVNNIVVDNLVYQLSINKTSFMECKQRFNLEKSTMPNTWKFHQNNFYTYLHFNKGILIEIDQFTFDRDFAG
jgi:hypothetical protein